MAFHNTLPALTCFGITKAILLQINSSYFLRKKKKIYDMGNIHYNFSVKAIEKFLEVFIASKYANHGLYWKRRASSLGFL